MGTPSSGKAQALDPDQFGDLEGQGCQHLGHDQAVMMTVGGPRQQLYLVSVVRLASTSAGLAGSRTTKATKKKQKTPRRPGAPTLGEHFPW